MNMNENLNLRKLLKDFPKETIFYSPYFGNVKFVRISEDSEDIVIETVKTKICSYVRSDGHMNVDGERSPEIMLFPSEWQRDWSKWKYPSKKDRFDPRTLQPFDKVLCRQLTTNWQCNMFSYTEDDWKNINYPFHCFSNVFMYTIPYNDDTKHLVGTSHEAPEYYRYWED